jgi:hypothetical protein
MEVKINSVQKAGVMSAVQFSTFNTDQLDYITGNIAIKLGIAQVNEVDESGKVNRLRVKNNSQHFLFFMDGDILSGAKQNRVLNTSLFIAPFSETEIPVSCVEKGRWNYKSKNFSSTNFTAPHNIRFNKNRQTTRSLRERMNYSADQHSIWEEVDKYQKDYGYDSHTKDLTMLFEKSQIKSEGFEKHFIKDKKSNGLAVFVNNEVVCADIFGRSDVLEEYFSKIIRSVGIEASVVKEKEYTLFDESEIKYKTFEFLDMLGDLKSEQYKSISAGHQKRFISDTVSGFSLEFKNIPVHISALNLIGGNNG